MKCLYLLLVVTVVQGFAVEDTRVKRSADIPAPKLLSLVAIDPPGFEIEWGPVPSTDLDDPILGYKVKIWELPGIKTMTYKVIDGVKTLVEEVHPPKLNFDKVPDSKPQEITTDKTKILVANIKLDIFYETRVQAYSKGKEGPLSEPMRIKLHKNDHSKDIYKTV